MSDSEPTVLRSSANPKLRHLLRMRDNRARRRASRVLVDGWRETAQALRAGLGLRGVYLSEATARWCESESDADIETVLNASADPGVRFLVAEPMMERISFGQSSRGVVAEFDQPQRDLEGLRLPPESLVLVLDQIEKPGNVGAAFRSADAAGVNAIILCDCDCDLYNPNAIRGSLGAVFRVPSATTTQSELAPFLSQSGLRTLAARVESSTPLWSSDLSTPLAIILGSEAWGLSERWRRLGEHPIDGIRIPMFGEVDSLNVSVSAAVIAYEVARRRKAAGPLPA